MKILEISQYMPQKSMMFLDVTSKGRERIRKLDEYFLKALFLFLEWLSLWLGGIIFRHYGFF